MSEAPKESAVQTVERLAALTRLSIPAERKEALAAEFDSILAYIGKLDELDVAVGGVGGVRAAPAVPPLHNVFREDANPTPSSTWTEPIVNAFPAKSGNALSVKKILSID